jgi:hypothetical protein
MKQENIRRFILTPLIALTLVSGAVAPMARAAYATDTNDDWHYVRREDSGCPKKSTDVDTTAASKSETVHGDAFTPGTEQYNTAKKMFETLTQVYGISGTCAAGIMGHTHGESAMRYDVYEGSGHFGLHGSTVGSDAHSSWSGIGGGIFQETPFSNFTTSKFWSYPNSEGGGGWYPENQVAFQMDKRFAHGGFVATENANADNYANPANRGFNGGFPFNTRKVSSNLDFFTEKDPREACKEYFVGAGIGIPGAPGQINSMEGRMEAAMKFNALFNKDNVPADVSKMQAMGILGDSQGLPGSIINTSSLDTVNTSKKCRHVKSGDLDAGTFLGIAKQIAADKNSGYSQDETVAPRGGNWKTGDDIDCSNFVMQCLRRSGNPEFAKIDQLLAGENSFGSVLTPLGFERHDFNADELQPGDILLRDGHCEIFLGWFDVTKLDANGNPTEVTKDTPGAVPLQIGSHSDETSGGGTAAKGDGGQSQDGNWYDPNYAQEVSAYKLGSNWTSYWRAPKGAFDFKSDKEQSADDAANVVNTKSNTSIFKSVDTLD